MRLLTMIALALLSMARVDADAAVTNYHAVKAAASGRKSLLGATTNLDANCGWLGISPARIVEAPQHGRLFVTSAMDFPQFGNDNDRYKCRFKKYPSQRLYYQSALHYVGQDRFTIENVTPYGDINVATFDVVVQ